MPLRHADADCFHYFTPAITPYAIATPFHLDISSRRLPLMSLFCRYADAIIFRHCRHYR
jgi:hypothetical protein